MKKFSLRLLLPGMGLLVLMFCLAACTGELASSGANTTTNTITPTPVAKPVTFTGDGFSIVYPNTWDKTLPGSPVIPVEFSNGSAHVEVVGDTSNTASVAKESTMLTTTLGSPFTQVGSTETVVANGIRWTQTVGTTVSPQTNQQMKLVLWTASNLQHNAKYKVISLMCMSYVPNYAAELSNYYSPMLRSFKFM